MRLAHLRAFLNPFSAYGGAVGRLAVPAIMTVAALFTIPGSPVQIAGMIDGLDVSVYSGEIDRARWEQSGTAVAVVGAWHGGSANPYAETSLSNARASGKITGTYCYIVGTRDIVWQIDRCKDATGGEWAYLNFVAVDAEDKGLSVDQVIEGLQRVEALGGRAITYSGCWFISGGYLAGDVSRLAPWPYWNAAYTLSQEFEGVRYNNCIPGARLMGEQYAGSGMWGAGENIWSDRNVFDDVFIREGYPFSAPPEPTPVVSVPLPSNGSTRSALRVYQVGGTMFYVAAGELAHIPSVEALASLWPYELQPLSQTVYQRGEALYVATDGALVHIPDSRTLDRLWPYAAVRVEP